MTQSAEYPDLRWMPPKSWTNTARQDVQVIVIHDTEGAEGITAAEDGAAYDQRRTDGTSTHYFHDADSTVQCVRTEDQAHAARTQGNRRGIQHELCGRAGQGAAGWADPVSQGTLRQAARQVARDCRKWNIPARKLTPAQVAAGVKGICGHADITAAFPQDQGTHTDPGPTFPWSQFLALVQAELEDDMPLTVDDANLIINQLGTRLRTATADTTDLFVKGMRAVAWQYTGSPLPENVSALAAINTILANAGPDDDVDEAAIARQVLAGMDYRTIAETVAAAIPRDQAQQLLDALAARLQA